MKIKKVKHSKIFILLCSLLLMITCCFVSVGASSTTEDLDELMYNEGVEVGGTIYSNYQPYAIDYFYGMNQSLTYSFVSPYYTKNSSYVDAFNTDEFYFAIDNYWDTDLWFIDCANSFEEQGPTGITSFAFGYSTPRFLEYDYFSESPFGYIVFLGLDVPCTITCYYDISYIIVDSISLNPSLYNIQSSYIYSDYTSSDIDVSTLINDCIDLSFDIEEPYGENRLVLINSFYMTYNIDWQDYVGEEFIWRYYFNGMKNNYYLSVYSNLPSYWYGDNFNNDFEPIIPEDPDGFVDVGTGLLNGLSNFLSFQIIPNFSLASLLALIVGIPLLIYILKLFLGG